MTKTSKQRREYIQNAYSLTQNPDGVWVACCLFQGKTFSQISGKDREKVCFVARGQWGHFNFEDEAEEFNKIFGRGNGR